MNINEDDELLLKGYFLSLWAYYDIQAKYETNQPSWLWENGIFRFLGLAPLTHYCASYLCQKQ